MSSSPIFVQSATPFPTVSASIPLSVNTSPSAVIQANSQEDRTSLDDDDTVLVADIGDYSVQGDLILSGDDSHGDLTSLCVCCGKLAGSCPIFIRDQVEIIFQIHRTHQANQDGLRIPITTHFLHHGTWEKELHGYWDKQAIIDGIRFGWDIGIVGVPKPKSATRNHPSAIDHLNDVRHYVATELAHGCLLGPVSRNDLPFPITISPLGAVPKPHSLRHRIITDCSFNGYGINAFIPKRWYRGQYWKITLPGIDDIINDIREVKLRNPGEEVVGFKMDLSRYFRCIGVDPGQVPFLAISVDGEIYLDLSFSFGNRGAMVAAQRQSDGISWIFRTKIPPSPGVANSGRFCQCSGPCKCGDNFLRDYVDDFIGICTKKQSEHLWDSFHNLLQRLGLKPSETPGHLCPPSAQFVGLGIQFDLQANTISIPCEKLADVIALLQLWRFKLAANSHDLQALLGKLLHVCRVVRSGRLQLSRMLDTLRRCLLNNGSAISLDNNFFLDLRWWEDNLTAWNGVSLLLFKDHQNMVALDASTDGSFDGGPGLGGFNFMSQEFFKCGVPEEWRNWHISDLELVCHIIAIRLWGIDWSGLQVWGLTDSEPCELLLRHGRSRVNRRLQMARTIASLEHRLQFIWVSGPIRLSLIHI